MATNCLLLPIRLDELISEKSATARASCKNLLLGYWATPASAVLSSDAVLYLYLRDFGSTAKGRFEWYPFVGCRIIFGNRDEAVLALLPNLALPLVPVANPRDGVPTSKDFKHIRLHPIEWLGDVLRLATLSKGILVIVPFDGPLKGVVSASELEVAVAVARREVENPKTAGLAAELLAILEEPSLRRKVIVGAADITDLGVVSEFASMRTFKPINGATLDEHFLSAAGGNARPSPQ